MVYLIHRERVQAFPDTTLLDEDSSMLGQRQTTEVRLFRSFVQPGDRILLVDGPMARQLGTTRIGQIVSGNVEQSISNLATLAPPEDCTALVIQVGAAAAHEAEQWAFMPVETPALTEAETTIARVPAPPRPQPQGSAAAQEVAAETIEEPRQAPSPSRMPAGPTVGERTKAVLQTLGRGARAVGERILPDQDTQRSTSRRRRQAARSRRDRGETVRRPRWGLAAAIALPILVLLLVGGSKLYRDWSIQSQFNEQLEAARLKRDIALSSAESPTVARDYWLEVIALTNEADSVQPGNAEISEMREQAQAAIDGIDMVTRLGPAIRLYEYGITPGAPGRVIVAGLDVYVLDRAGGRVYHHPLNETRTALRNPNADQVLVQQGQPLAGHNIGTLIDIAWMKEGGERQAGELLILDQNALLLRFDPSWEQLQAETVSGKDVWQSPSLLSTYDSNLYLLDTAANQIYKYANQQYANEPAGWLKEEGTDLGAAVDMGIDGSIYVLHSSGKMQKLYGGEAVSFSLGQMPQPLTSAAALYLETEDVAQYVYIADASQKRILQLEREGMFARQLKPARDQEDTFEKLSGIFVDETGGKLYYVAARGLYITDLPPLQR
jgi:hypothetical protein